MQYLAMAAPRLHGPVTRPADGWPRRCAVALVVVCDSKDVGRESLGAPGDAPGRGVRLHGSGCRLLG